MPRGSKNNNFNTVPEQTVAPMYGYPTAPVAGQAPVSIPQPSAPESPDLSGLYVFGQVVDRTRRTIPTRDNSTTEIVTYTVRDVAGRNYYVDEYSPDSYNDIGSIVEYPVYVKTFKKRNGDPSYSFCVQQQMGHSTRGERF